MAAPDPGTEAPTGHMRPGLTLRELLTTNGGLLINTVIWGTFFPVLEVVLRYWDYLSATSARQVVGAIASLVVLTLISRRFPLRRDRPWGALIAMGFVGIVLGALLTTLGVYFSSGLSAAIISATNPISSALTAWALHRVPLTRAILVGALLSVAGGVLAVAAGQEGNLNFGLGEALIVLANMLWTGFSLALQHHLRGWSQLERATLTLTPAAICLVAISLLAHVTGLHRISIDLEITGVIGILYLGIAPIAIGNFLWHWGVSRIGVNIASMYNNMIPITAVAVTLWFGVYPSWGQLIGGAVILAGVAYAQLAAFAKSRAS